MKASAAIRRDEEIMRSPEPGLSLNSLGFMQDNFMAQTTPEKHLEEDISIHIFTVSSAMVGVCLTVIGLIRVVITFGKADTIADDLLAVDAFFFLVSCLLSYSALRTRSKRRMHRRERIADSIFVLAMILMVVICGFITYAIAIPGK
jgi:amino acid transporter